MKQAVDEFGQTIVMVTHDPIAASYASRVVFLADGNVTDELADPNPDSILDRMRRLDHEPTPDMASPDVEGHPQGTHRAQAALRSSPRSR